MAGCADGAADQRRRDDGRRDLGLERAAEGARGRVGRARAGDRSGHGHHQERLEALEQPFALCRGGRVDVALGVEHGL